MPTRERDALLQGSCPWAGFGHLQTLKGCTDTFTCRRHCLAFGKTGAGHVFSTLTCVWRSSPDMEEVPQKSEGTLHLCLSLLGFARVDKGKVPHLCLACLACSPDLQEGFEGRTVLWRTYRSTGINTSAVLGVRTLVKTFTEIPWTAACLMEGTRQSSEAVSSGLPWKAVLYTTVHHPSSHAVCLSKC